MNFELIKTILFFISGGFLIFLAITLTRDNFSHRLNRITGAMLAFAGIGPIFMALGSVISQSNSSIINFEDSLTYNLVYLWEFFFPCLLVFSWIGLFSVQFIGGIALGHHLISFLFLFLPVRVGIFQLFLNQPFDIFSFHKWFCFCVLLYG